MVQPRPVSLTQVNESDYEGAYEPEPLLIVGPVPGGGGGGGGSTAWSDITGKPATFTPSAHTQAISTIIGLQAELDSKATPDEIPTTPGDIGAASAAQGALADTAVQPAALATLVPNTRTVAGKPLSADVTLAKADVGLGSVDNTSDANKPVSTATQTALNLKANTVDVVPNTRTVAGKALSANVTLVKADVGLGNVDNTSDANKPVSTAQATAINAKVGSPNSTITGLAYYPTVASLPATGTAGVIYYVDSV